MNNALSFDNAEEDDYIYMELGSYSNPTHHPTTSPQHHQREFEFQMSSNPFEKETSTSPADELFYKGKLLPLHLPPRLQMVEKLLQSSTLPGDERKDALEESYSTPLATTPFESCNISPSESCRISRELNPDEYIYEDSIEMKSILSDENPKKSWTRKIKLIKQSSISYLKALFGKSGPGSAETRSGNWKNVGEGLKTEGPVYVHEKPLKRYPFGHIQGCKNQSRKPSLKGLNEEKISENGVSKHRRSFSVSIKRNSLHKILLSSSSSSSASSSANSSSSSVLLSSIGASDLNGMRFLKRSSSAKSEMESPIQGAIAHCKRSHQLFGLRKTASEAGFYSFSASRMSVSEDYEKPADLCRG